VFFFPTVNTKVKGEKAQEQLYVNQLTKITSGKQKKEE
jgi:hypothetical protein